MRCHSSVLFTSTIYFWPLRHSLKKTDLTSCGIHCRKVFFHWQQLNLILFLFRVYIFNIFLPRRRDQPSFVEPLNLQIWQTFTMVSERWQLKCLNNFSRSFGYLHKCKTRKTHFNIYLFVYTISSFQYFKDARTSSSSSAPHQNKEILQDIRPASQPASQPTNHKPEGINPKIMAHRRI